MAKFIEPVQWAQPIPSDYLVTSVPSLNFVLWDGKVFRKRDGSKFASLPEDFTWDIPDVQMLGWVSTDLPEMPVLKDPEHLWRRVYFWAFDLPEAPGLVEDRIDELDRLWRGSRSWHFRMSVSIPPIMTKPHLWLRKPGSKWKDPNWLFEVSP